jgi:multidrug efflux system membrane fusion protein
MNRSVLIAVAIALVATLWILSGMVGGEPKAAADGENVTIAADTVAEQPPKRVRVRDSVAQPMRATLSLYGQTQALQDVTLRAEAEGPVESISVHKGQQVIQGQELMRLAQKDRQARLDEARARVSQMALKYQQASKLARSDFASRSTVAEARANLENAQAALALVQEEMKNIVIRAPFPGVFDENTVEVGDRVAEGGEVGRLLRLDPIKVVAEVSERNLSQVDREGEAEITLINGETYRGKVSWVAQAASTQTRTYRVEVTLDNPENRISAGMTAEVSLPLIAVKAHLVSPAILTLDDQGRIGVKTMDAENRVVFYEVRPVEDNGTGMWLTGLPETVRLITVGQDYVTVGGFAEPVPEDQAAEDVPAAGAAVPGAGQ